MDKWIKENKIVSGIILGLIVVLAVIYFNKQTTGIAGKNEFQKKKIKKSRVLVLRFHFLTTTKK